MYHPYGALPVPLYILICPDVATKYHRAHRWYPQYLFFNSQNSPCNFLLLFHFIYCTIFDIDRCGRAEISICTRSGLTFPLRLYRCNWRSKFLVLLLCFFRQYCHIILCTYTLYRILCELLLYVIPHIILKCSPKCEGFHPYHGMEIRRILKKLS